MLGLTQFSPKWLFLGVFKNSDIVRATRLTLGAVPLKDLVSEEPFLLLCFRFLPFVAEAAGPPPAPPRVMWSRGRGWGLDAGGKAPRGPARRVGACQPTPSAHKLSAVIRLGTSVALVPLPGPSVTLSSKFISWSSAL